MSLADQLVEELGEHKAESKPKASTRMVRPFSVFEAANGLNTIAVLDALGVSHHDSHRGEMAECPGCKEDGALVCNDGGLKCLHARCAEAGPAGNPGFRTNVDLAALLQRLEPLEAAKWLCARFSIDAPKMRHAERDPSQHCNDEAPDARPDSSPTTAPQNEPELITLGSLLGPAIERAERRRSGEEKPIPIPWASYAEALGGGLWPGAHYIVSGTGVGKSQLSIQMALRAASSGVPTVYIGLELEEFQIAARVLGDQSGVRWSGLYLGRCSAADIDGARKAAELVKDLPFYCEFSPARGWPPSRLRSLCAQLRRKHPQGPLLVILDYLQLVGDDVVEFERRPDTRERISSAATGARDVARRFDASVVVISSAARAHYGLLASDCKEAGLTTRTVPGRFEPVRTILRPSALLGLGKESGETEYSADSVTAMIRWPAPLDNGETAIILATPKVRSVGERWCALAFDGSRFAELNVRDVDELPEVAKRGGKGPAVDEDELETRVVETVRSAGKPFTSKTAIACATKGTKGLVIKAVDRLLESGQLIQNDGTFSVRGSEETNQ